MDRQRTVYVDFRSHRNQTILHTRNALQVHLHQERGHRKNDLTRTSTDKLVYPVQRGPLRMRLRGFTIGQTSRAGTVCTNDNGETKRPKAYPGFSPFSLDLFEITP